MKETGAKKFLENANSIMDAHAVPGIYIYIYIYIYSLVTFLGITGWYAVKYTLICTAYQNYLLGMRNTEEYVRKE